MHLVAQKGQAGHFPEWDLPLILISHTRNTDVQWVFCAANFLIALRFAVVQRDGNQILSWKLMLVHDPVCLCEGRLNRR